jgi:lipoate-protein ligase A
MKLLDLTLPMPAANLALDEALLDALEAGQGGEVLRFWESPVPFVVVGYANRLATEVNLEACTARNIPVLRRCSGGGTVVQGPGCLNYALILRTTDAPPFDCVPATNQFVMERHRAVFAKLLDARVEVQGHTDLALGGVKFSGNAQRRKRDALLFHGTFLTGFDLGLIAELLPMPSQQPEYRHGRPHGEFVANLPLTTTLIREVIADAWEARDALVSPDLAAVAKLVETNYSRPEWNAKF